MPSTVIRRFAYRPQLAALDIEFVSGRVYRYHGVPEPLAGELAASRAKGVAFNRIVRGRYACERLPAWDEPPEALAALADR